MSQQLDFNQLVAPHESSDFFERYWQKSLLLIKGEYAGRFQSLIPATEISDVLAIAQQLPADAVQLVGEMSGSEDDPALPQTLAEFFRKGATIRIRGVEKYCNPLTELCGSLEQELGFPTRANLYCTPAGARGFDLHFDTHEVLVLQILGRKRWQVYEPTVRLPLEYVPPLPFEDDLEALKRSRGGRSAGQDAIDPKELGSLLLETTIEPGDCLYLPRGFVHQANSLDEPSVHITIGIHVLTWLDLLSVALGQSAYRNVGLRQALPVGPLSDPDFRKSFEEQFAERVQRFSQDADFESALSEFTETLHRSRSAKSNRVNHGSLAHETKLKGNGRLQVYLSEDGAMSGLALGQKIFWMPVCFASAFRFVAESKAFSAHELPGVISDSGKLTLVRRLVDDGFLRIAD